ncbi:hypothetical protein [Promicromonospora sp. NPDC050262]|uniref:hypothetical protein n=1 Tax=Promicromonospora sp. NPDC050262 TaxID=3155036 RepID=UPI0033D49D25
MADDTQDQVSNDPDSTDSPPAADPDADATGATDMNATDTNPTDTGATDTGARAAAAPEAGASPADEDVPSSPESTVAAGSADATVPQADTGRVARIVAALRKAHAEQAARTAEPADPGTETSESEPPAPRRATSGVRPAAPRTPTLHWNPGARYRASQLANQPAPMPPAPTPPAPMPPAPTPAVPPPPGSAAPGSAPHVPAPPVAGPPALAGRLFRGPARRTAVFEREIWHPSARSSRVPSDVGEALVAAVERYRKGSISTSGLVRAIANTHAA